LLPPLGDIDSRLSLPLGVEDLGALCTFGGNLAVHSCDDIFWGMDVSNLIAEADNAPDLGGFIDGSGDVDIEGGAFAQDMVEGELTDFGAHRRLRKLGDGVFSVFDVVAVMGRQYLMRNSSQKGRFFGNWRIYLAL